MGFGDWGFWVRTWDLGCGVWGVGRSGLGCGVWAFGFGVWVWGLGFEGLGFGLGCRGQLLFEYREPGFGVHDLLSRVQSTRDSVQD